MSEDRARENRAPVEEEEEEEVEVPSCIESLVNSSAQLQQLATQISQYYVKGILSYAYSSDLSKPSPDVEANERQGAKGCPKATKATSALERQKLDLAKLMEDDHVLGSMQSIVGILPFLSGLSKFIERCFATLEATFKRLNYHLGKAHRKNLSSMHDIEFRLTLDTKLNSIFISIMDLLYSLVSLDKTIQSHTNIGDSLERFTDLCRLITESPASNLCGLDKVPLDKLRSLFELVKDIQLTLCCQERTIFQQILERVQHLNLGLSMETSKSDSKTLREHIEQFIIFYGDHLIELDRTFASRPLEVKAVNLIDSNLMPSVHMTSTSRKVFGLSSLFVLYNWIFKKTNKRVNKIMVQVWQSFKSLNMVCLTGSNSFLLLSDFLEAHLPKSVLDSKTMKQLDTTTDSLLKFSGHQLDQLTIRVAAYLIQFKSESLRVSEPSETFAILKRQMCLFQRGLAMTEEINQTIKIISSVYLHHKRPMSKANLVPLFRLVPLLKSIETCFRQNQLLVNSCLIKTDALVRVHWTRLMVSVAKRLISLKYSERKLAPNLTLTLSALCSHIDRCTTNNGRITLSLCLPMLIPMLEADELSKMNTLLELLSLDIHSRLESSAHCGYLYWSMPTFGVYYNYAFEENPCAIEEIHYFHQAINDIPSLFKFETDQIHGIENDTSAFSQRASNFLDALNGELVEQFKTDFLDKICQEFEMELRLQTHRNIYLDSHNPFRRHLYNFKHIFASPKWRTFKIFDRTISLHYYVEQHLNRICYNLTSIAPHDWFTYDNMLNLARHKYNLEFANLQLPIQTLDSGLDLLDITRNLGLFVSRYSYDLTNQFFMEKSTNRLSASSSSGGSIYGGASVLSAQGAHNSSQSLNVVQIKHVSRSIQTHGFGLLNSSVNCTYQVMKRLINMFAKQISDDKLRAILAKERQQLVANVGRSSIMNYDKANKIAKRFKLNHIELGNQQSGTDLDSLRQIITQLGNLLALVRMLKSGALNCVTKSVSYLPELDDLSLLRLGRFVECEFKSYQLDSLMKASENFDQCLEDFDENFTPRSNYFSILIGLFGNLLTTKRHEASPLAKGPNEAEKEEATKVGGERSSDGGGLNKCQNLTLFYLMVPALTINYIDYIVKCKERASSRSSSARFGALLSDDGFSMGVAFLLTVLGQVSDFAKFEWFKQVGLKLEEDKQEVERRAMDLMNEQSIQQTSVMTLRRLAKLKLEYESLNYTLSSALLFFRSSTLDGSS